MVLKAKNAIIPVGLALIVGASACKKDENKTDLLIGEWEIVEIDGDDPDGKTTFEFSKPDNFDFCYDDGYSGNSCVDGEWSWTGKLADEVEMEVDILGDTYKFELKIESITKDEIEGELTSDGDTYDVVLEKD